MSEKKTREKRQDELAKKVGDILVAAQNAHTEELVHTMKRTGDYIVTVAFEVADGMYEKQSDGELEWETPEGYGTMHVEIMIQDRDDKRFVPYLEVSAKVFDNENHLVTESEAPFMWHPYAYHYGFHTLIPDEGKYTVEVTIKAPKYPRHHKSHGKRYEEDVVVRMASVQLMPPGSGDPEDDILKQ